MLPDAEEPGDASGEGFFQPLHVGLRFLQQARAEHRSWASTCHAGFRPVCLLGAGQASQVSTSFVDGALPKGCQGCIHAGCTGFVSGGLMQRVVRDRALELCRPEALREILGRLAPRLPRRPALANTSNPGHCREACSIA